MKFANFCKKYVPYVRTVKSDSMRWANCGLVYALIPDGFGDIGSVVKEDTTLNTILHDAEWAEVELTDAYLPHADDKASEIIRVFSDGSVNCNILNAHFGFIEKHDMCAIARWTEDDEERRALLVGPYADIDDFEPTGIILDCTEV